MYKGIICTLGSSGEFLEGGVRLAFLSLGSGLLGVEVTRIFELFIFWADEGGALNPKP